MAAFLVTEAPAARVEKAASSALEARAELTKQEIELLPFPIRSIAA